MFASNAEKRRFAQQQLDTVIDVNRVSHVLDSWERHMAVLSNAEQVKQAWLTYRKRIESELLGHCEQAFNTNRRMK